MFKVNIRNTRKRCEICSKLTLKTLERCQWLRILNQWLRILLRIDLLFASSEISTSSCIVSFDWSVFLITSGTQISNNYAPCFNRIHFVVIPSYIELPCLYRSPSQTGDIFETLADNFELTWDTLINKNQFLFVALGDFNDN